VDAVELLKHDHRMVEQLFRIYDAAHSDRQRRGVVEITVRELSKHAALEEVTVYPFAKRFLGDSVDVDEQLGEHMSIKKTLAKSVAPTRPHPAAPDHPPALTLAAPFVAIFDRLRDRVQGRPAT
jgi:Hemerythrin HHE cation binding domain